jgi:addiction module RelB/DinJ family antitoxin
MTAVVSTTIDAETKRKAQKVLKDMGLTMSQVCRMLMERTIALGRLPFDPPASMPLPTAPRRAPRRKSPR